MKKKKILVGMDFPSAMERIIEGKRVTRIPWAENEFGALQDGFLELCQSAPQTKKHPAGVMYGKWTPSAEDVMANDWIIYES